MLDVITLIDHKSYVLLDTLCKQFPKYTRYEIVSCMREFAAKNETHSFHYGRKGYPTRIENKTTRLARTKVDLIPDNPADGPMIPAGALVSYVELNSLNEYEVHWDVENVTTWAHANELTFKD